MKIAVIGTGIAGLGAAYYLNKEHDITVFEKRDRIGGHTATIDVEINADSYAIDTGFIVFNDWTYPNFIRLLNEIGVQSQETRMSFSVSNNLNGLEYAGSNLNTLFAQRSNLLRPSFYRMVKDILRFNKEAVLHVESINLDNGAQNASLTLGDYLTSHNYSEEFIRHYLIPMGAAIWSSGTEDMMQFPLHFFVRFFKNHGLLNIKDRPQWRTIKGGSREYLQPLTRHFADKIITNANIHSVSRSEEHVEIIFEDGKRELFDQVVFACHSDQALKLLQDSTDIEQQVLGAIPYIDNEVVLHTDISLLPKRRLAWSSWNYLIDSYQQELPALTYNMNILQNLETDTDFCVTLNKTSAIDPKKILATFNYAHPKFTIEGIDAQARWQEVNGINRTWFCGAWWRNGFHEDGLVSGLRVANALNQNKTDVLEY